MERWPGLRESMTGRTVGGIKDRMGQEKVDEDGVPWPRAATSVSATRWRAVAKTRRKLEGPDPGSDAT